MENVKLSWDDLANAIGDLYDDKEFKPVLVKLQTGHVIRIAEFDTKNIVLIAEKD